MTGPLYLKVFFRLGDGEISIEITYAGEHGARVRRCETQTRELPGPSVPDPPAALVVLSPSAAARRGCLSPEIGVPCHELNRASQQQRGTLFPPSLAVLVTLSPCAGDLRVVALEAKEEDRLRGGLFDRSTGCLPPLSLFRSRK